MAIGVVTGYVSGGSNAGEGEGGGEVLWWGSEMVRRGGNVNLGKFGGMERKKKSSTEM